MMLHEFTQVDIQDYREYVFQHKNATPYHNPAWGQAITESYSFETKYFGLLDNKQIVAVLPTIKMKSLKASTFLCSLPYCDLGGALANTDEFGNELLRQVTHYASTKKLGFEYRSTVNPYYENACSSEVATNISDGDKVRMLYKLRESVEEQLAFFKPKLRSQIKKASKNGIQAQVIPSPTKQDLHTFYQVFATNMRDLGSPVHSIDWFNAIFEHYKSNAFMVMVSYEGKCVGGSVVIHTQTKAVIPWASTLRDYNKLAPNMLLYWEVLSEVIRRNIFEFDFGRSSFNEGTYRFKKQWGASPTPLAWKALEDGQLIDEQASETSTIRKFVENTWQKLPLGLTIFVGPKVRKYISL